MVMNKVQYDSIEIEFGRSPAHDLDPDLDLRILQREHLVDPRNTRVLFYLAREYYDKRQFEEAQKHFEKYLTKASFQEEMVEAMYLLAHSYWLDGKSNGEKARFWCGQAICRNPHFK